jgi:hypothetical protein
MFCYGVSVQLIDVTFYRNVRQNCLTKHNYFEKNRLHIG